MFLVTWHEWDSPYLCTCVEKLILGGYAARNLNVKSEGKGKAISVRNGKVLRDLRRLRLPDFKTTGT